jgi:pimeloyl-ACP methyl ester carboxylesterase
MGNKSSNSNNQNTITEFFVNQPDELLKNKAYSIEREILSKSELKLDEQLYVEDVIIDYFGTNYFHTIRCGKPEDKITQNLVILHGYQGSSITFHKLFKFLYPKYNIYCPDLIGMGLSSRPKIDFKSTQEWIDFFIGALEKWRETLKIEKFHLIGHSLGGYLSGLYSLKYPERITKLTLLSPAGITDVTKGGSINEKMPFGKKIGFAMLGAVWGLKPTMKGAYDNPISRLVMKSGLRKRYDVDKEEGELLAKLTEIALAYPPDLDRAIYYIFKHPIPTVNIPLEDKLFDEVKDFKIDFYFGEEDWMDQIGSIRLCEKDEKRFKFFIVSKKGHNFNLENAEELGKYILDNHTLEEVIDEIDHLALDNQIEVKFSHEKVDDMKEDKDEC